MHLAMSPRDQQISRADGIERCRPAAKEQANLCLGCTAYSGYSDILKIPARRELAYQGSDYTKNPYFWYASSLCARI